ncbi:MAG TPA: glycosyltransferase family 2 protein [Candidatus Saccharimonas sp.]|nr:glycosyltransferase family 2 protein [Candidatus Saccharimonas sp.]
MNSDVCVIIPAHNESQVIGQVLEGVLERFSRVVVVNDGSSDNTAEVARRYPVTVLSHAVNLGQGGAMQTGFDWALQQPEVEYFISFDSDGQHRVEDAERMLAEARKGDVDLVLGSRFLDGAVRPPGSRRWLLLAATWFNYALTGLHLTDAHVGLRVFNRRAASELKLTMSDMTHATEIESRIRQKGWRYKEIPVTIDYTDYSRSARGASGQRSSNAINLAFDLLLHRLGGGK